MLENVWIITHYFARLRNTPYYMRSVLDKSTTRGGWGRREWGSVTAPTRFGSSYMMCSFAEGVGESGVLLHLLPGLIPLTWFCSQEVGIPTSVREPLFVLWLTNQGSYFGSLCVPWLVIKAFQSQCKQHPLHYVVHHVVFCQRQSICTPHQNN